MPTLIAIWVALLATETAPAMAHGLSSATASSLWSYDAWLMTPLYIVGISFYLGTQRLWRGAGFGHGVKFSQAAAFWTGWSVLALVMTTPLHWLGEHLFSAHMVEHEVLMVVAAPLMAFARINGPIMWCLPRAWRSAAGTLLASATVAAAWRFISHPATATILHALALWIWHAPRLYHLALESNSVHRIQHLSFFLTALLFWWVLLNGRFASRKARDGIAVVCLFLTVLHCGLLGALLTLSVRLWIPQQGVLAEDFGFTPLEDQQLAGLLMWIPMGTVYTCAALCFAGRLLRPAKPGVRAHPEAADAFNGDGASILSGAIWAQPSSAAEFVENSRDWSFAAETRCDGAQTLRRTNDGPGWRRLSRSPRYRSC